ncbi:MAG: hypothetical protein ACLFTA_03085 [Candidatus Nanohaloarchaea archaeon]
MVVWKGEIERRHGEKAYNLDNANLEVPNFFVVTSEEVEQIFHSRDPQEVLNKSIDIENVKEAYDDVGMSSEVRNASSRARNLVGGQRNSTRVSVRISDRSDADFELDVGKADIEDALKTVAASYFEEGGENYPNMLVQKMIEPDYTGALIKGDEDYVEAVEGLGIALEEGTTVPTMFSIGEEIEARIPERQLKVTRNPMTGEFRQRRIEPERPFEASELENLSQETDESVKFVYKRGSFYIVDRFEAERYSQSLEYVQVTPERVEGTVGKDIKLSDETLPPEEYRNALVTRKGGYTSNDARKAREAGKAAAFSCESVEEGDSFGEEKQGRKEVQASVSGAATPLYSISELESGFEPGQAYLKDYAEVFSFEGDSAILDGRMLDSEALPESLDYVSGDLTVLLDHPDREALKAVVENGFSLGVPEHRIGEFEEALGKAERSFILEKLRQLD